MGLVTDSFIPDTLLLDFSISFQCLDLRSLNARCQSEKGMAVYGHSSKASPSSPRFSEMIRMRPW